MTNATIKKKPLEPDPTVRHNLVTTWRLFLYIKNSSNKLFGASERTKRKKRTVLLLTETPILFFPLSLSPNLLLRAKLALHITRCCSPPLSGGRVLAQPVGPAQKKFPLADFTTPFVSGETHCAARGM